MDVPKHLRMRTYVPRILLFMREVTDFKKYYNILCKVVGFKSLDICKIFSNIPDFVRVLCNENNFVYLTDG